MVFFDLGMAVRRLRGVADHRHAVLLIEDHDDSRLSFQALMEANGLRVVAVRTGKEGLALLRATPWAWCVVVLDWWLPDMDGAEFVRRQGAHPTVAGIPITVITGDATIAAKARALGVEHFFLKPVEPDAIIGLLTNHCAGGAPRRAVVS